MTNSKQNYKRGDLVLLNFTFSEETGVKQRPTLILSAETYMKDRQEIIVAAITSNVGRILTGDYRIKHWKEAGLLYPSVVTGIIRTVKQSMIQRKLGILAKADFQAVERNLKAVLGF